ncbi:MAG TPA: glycosyltransferase family 9 protein [Kofleriaceae bacterium]|nr:glycosyltransferase family 9 protein [Kofleriaceae bacterium]
MTGPLSIDRALQSGGGLYCAAYTGLGDALLLGPILRELSRRYPGRVFYPENPVLALYRRLGVPGLVDVQGSDPGLRRLLDPLDPALLAFLERHRIAAVLNFRRDLLQHGDAYRRGAALLAARGLHVSDLCSGTRASHHQTRHVAELAAEYAEGLGVSAPASPGWLREAAGLPRSPARGPVVLYAGAGQVHKRLGPAFWIRLAGLLHPHAAGRLVVLAGVTEPERRDGQAISDALRAAEVDHQLLVALDLFDVTTVLARAAVAVSCDTYLVHLCSALDVPLVGLYPATSAVMYGPHHPLAVSLSSPYYRRCPSRNAMGNCDAWEHGCDDTPCHDELSADDTAAHVTRLAGLGPGAARPDPIEVVAPCPP